MNLTIRTDRHYIRTGHRSNRFVLVELTAPAAPPRADRAPVNIAFVLDRSGSMEGRKIQLARRAVEAGIGRLERRDRFAVVVYDELVDVVVPTTPATPEARETALARVAAIDARGVTNLGEGWLRGCEQVAQALDPNAVNRTLLLTDGLANVGITDPDVLTTHAAELWARGVGTSTFGVGTDFDHDLLQAMADAGAGHFYYIDRAEKIPDFITSEVGEALEVVAREVAIEVTVPDGVLVESLSRFRVERRDGRTAILLGDLVSEQRIAAVLRLNFPLGEVGAEVGAQVGVRDRTGVLTADGRRLVWAYADDRTNDFQERDREVDRAVARVLAARARREALRLNREGDFDAAAARLTAIADEIDGYAGDDPELRAIVDGLITEVVQFKLPIAKPAFMALSFRVDNLLQMRDDEGRALRVGDLAQDAASDSRR